MSILGKEFSQEAKRNIGLEGLVRRNSSKKFSSQTSKICAQIFIARLLKSKTFIWADTVAGMGPSPKPLGLLLNQNAKWVHRKHNKPKFRLMKWQHSTMILKAISFSKCRTKLTQEKASRGINIKGSLSNLNLMLTRYKICKIDKIIQATNLDQTKVKTWQSLR